ncbi:alpha/beta hydrolase [Lentzea sp. NPDC034063]|uniref:alpha/beta hydrolase n=1 Tax=unclassified Lentzea TaxID=2643253 RepID=UPI0033D67157
MTLRQGQHTIVIDGVTQAFEVAGSGPICIAHSGGPGIRSGYLRVPPLEQRLTMVYLDPIGTGRSGLLPGGAYSMERYAAFSGKLAEHLGVERYFFLGHSHGGCVGLQLALDAPEVLEGLILYSGAPVFGSVLFEESGRQVEAKVARWHDREEVVEAARVFRAQAAHGLVFPDQEAASAYLNDVLPLYFADYRHTVAELGSLRADLTFDPDRRHYDWDVRAELHKIGTRTLIISGRHDFISPPRWVDELRSELPVALLAELTESGHFGHLEEPERFADAVLAFTAG